MNKIFGLIFFFLKMLMIIKIFGALTIMLILDLNVFLNL